MIHPPGHDIRLVQGDERSLPVARVVGTHEWAVRARVLKRDARSSVLAGDSPSGEVVVKSIPLDRPKDALARLVGSTRLSRQWRGSELLAGAGINAARHLALWRGRDEGGRLIESLAIELVRGPMLLRCLAQDNLRPRQARIELARAAGALVARMIQAGLFNRDQKPSNIIVTSAEPPETPERLVLLDPVGVRPLGLMNRQSARRRMLFALLVEPIGCDLDVPMRLRMEAMHACARALGAPRNAVRADFREIDQMLFEHGDPTPDINPLDEVRQSP